MPRVVSSIASRARACPKVPSRVPAAPDVLTFHRFGIISGWDIMRPDAPCWVSDLVNPDQPAINIQAAGGVWLRRITS